MFFLNVRNQKLPGIFETYLIDSVEPHVTVVFLNELARLWRPRSRFKCFVILPSTYRQSVFRPSEMTFCSTKCGKGGNVIAHNLILSK